MIVVLKVVGFAGATAVVALLETGDCVAALALIPALGTLWYATRLRAKRRALERVRS